MSSKQIQVKLLDATKDLEAYVAGYTYTDWQSITFDGRWHQITLIFSSEEHFTNFQYLVATEQIRFDLIGHKLCQIVVVESDSDNLAITIEALTLKD